jgi:hypothetical protein
VLQLRQPLSFQNSLICFMRESSVVDELQQRQALPAHVPQHVLAHSGDAAQQRVNVGRDGAPLREACSGAVQGSAGCSAQGSASCGVLHSLPVAHARSMARCCVEEVGRMMMEVTWQAVAGDHRAHRGSPALVTLPPLIAACSSFSWQGCAGKALHASRP